jgi:hypothetical protein
MGSGRPSSTDAAAMWDRAETPYLTFADRHLVLHFGDADYSLDNPVPGPQDSSFFTVEALDATQYSALASVSMPGQPRAHTRIVEVPREGQPRILATQALGLALTDATGSLAAWTERLSPTTTRVVAYDTATGAKTGTLEVPTDTLVVAVDGDKIYLSGTGSRVWTVGQDQARSGLPGAVPEDGFLVDADAAAGYLVFTDTGTVLFGPDGQVRHEFGDYLHGTFSPDGRYVSLLPLPDPDGTQRHEIYDIETGEVTQLDLPQTPQGLRFQWTPTGDLVAISVTGGDSEAGEVATYHLCRIPTGGCTDLGELPGDVIQQYEGSALGQGAFTSPED